jgi:hypothetical protein
MESAHQNFTGSSPEFAIMGSGIKVAATVVELGWRLELGLRGDWHGDAWGRCTQAYIGVWEESGKVKIRVRDKI